MSLNRRQRVTSLVGVFAVVGAIVSPVVASAVSSTANTTINATVASTISISTSSTVAIALTPTSGGVVSSNSDTVTVSTNNALGYNLTVKDADTNVNLVNGANNIAAHAGTPTVPTALANNTWGFAIATATTGAGTNAFDASYSAETNNASSATKWAGMPASSGTAYLLKSTAATASGDTTTVWYAAKATTSLPNGTYADTVTYTATTN